ncbi:MAG TPA: C69 family dipeptidase [Thermoanaerobaculaceae bacterium]|nr:C69 family dipeptidase [Thermoanaerobaculaceae bacterium]
MRRGFAVVVGLLTLFALAPRPANACTNLIITKGASADGSTFIAYAADSHELYGELYLQPGGVFPAGAMRDVIDWDSGKFLGRIPQAPRTYWRVGNINEHQVAIGETTFGGREELAKPEKGALVDYGSLMYIALERAKTAREAIQVMTGLATEYGYASEGESFSVADPNEAWILEMIGKGENTKGALWVARRIPDGYISGHANQSRIHTFPLHDPANCLYAPDVISFARAKGWFSGKDEEFSFADTYAPADFGSLRFCEARVWSMFRRAAPSAKLPFDAAKGVPAPLPLWIKPDKKLAVADAMALMRDHFEGTPLDMTKDVGAGPFACPYRWRPMEWEVDGKTYVHERAISTQQTGFSFIAQMRSTLPDPIGGVLWFGVDDTYSTVWTPMYCGIREVPKPFAVGVADLDHFSWDSAFWVFNWVANYAYSRYSDMIVDIQQVQRELEGRFIADQPEIDQAALALYNQAPALARDYLTRYSVAQGEMVHKRWRKLGEDLLVKYMDGNVKDSQGNVTHPEYPKAWYRRIVADHGSVIMEPPTPTPAPTPTH